MPAIYHIVLQADWDKAKSNSEYQAESLTTEGFIHCSKDNTQLFGVVRRLFAGQSDLLVLEIDTERLHSEVKYEPSTGGEVFPHIYGTINIDAVVRVHFLKTDAAGNLSLKQS